MSRLEFTENPGEGVAYLELCPEMKRFSARTVEMKHAGRELVFVDYDENGAIVGIEVLQ